MGCLEHLDLILGGNCDFLSLDDGSRQALTKGVVEGREGKGVIYVFASGNSQGQGADTNFEGLGTNSRMTISVGAVGKDGLVAVYSTPGASLFVSAPGGDPTNSVTNFVTASLNGGCSEAGEGTSFAAPVVSGVVALMLQANPELTWRDVQGIIAKTSQPVDDTLDYTAGINGVGLWHSNFYGFGIIDATAAVQAAETWELLGAERMIVGQSGTLNLFIPDDETQSVSDTMNISTVNPFVVESVYLYLRIESSSRGHLQIKLTSPSGVESILTPGDRPESTQLQENQWWKLLTLKFWGETPDGEWKLSVVDLKKGNVTGVGSCADYEWLVMELITCSALEEGEFDVGSTINRAKNTFTSCP
jgi:subtilisin family serine protease